MATTNTEPTDWRDVADQLTIHQRNLLARRAELFLRDGDRPAATVQALLLRDALQHVRRNAEDRERFGDVPAPAGAVYLWHFEINETDGGWHREFTGPYQECGGVTVWIYGQQRPDGSARASVSVNTDELAELDAATARELAELLVATAEHADRINGDAPPF